MSTRRRFLVWTGATPAIARSQALPDRADEPREGRFVRLWWFEHGMEHGNPTSNRRFRVNAPEVVLHPTFGYRQEVRSSGMLQILVEEDLRKIAGAELYLELWGGHPGTMHKRVTPNGRTTYWLPEVGTASGHCTHQYPTVRLKITDLAPGYNAFQFACDQGPSFWGHFIVDNACVRVWLPRSHPDIAKARLEDFAPSPVAVRRADTEILEISLRAADQESARIARVDYYGFYEGYDENGNAETRDWHGFTKNRLPVGHLGSSTVAPYRLSWDTSMLPAQRDMAVRATIIFKDPANLIYETAPLGHLSTIESRGATVKGYGLAEKPVPFWSRANQKRRATIELDIDPADIERAELHTVVWDGGRGGVKEYFTLNGRHFEVAGAGRHDSIYTILPVPPGLLRRGTNEIVLLSDTEHHGIEVLEPGPMLWVRSRQSRP